MRLASIRRYPVKSMGGEPLDSVEIDRRGLAGDRWFAVVDQDGKLASGKNGRRFRRRDAVFEHGARTLPTGDVEVTDGRSTWLVGTPTLDDSLSAAMGAAVEVRRETAVSHQDSGQVSLVGSATLDWFARELSRLSCDFSVLAPAALRAAVKRQSTRLQRLAGTAFRM